LNENHSFSDEGWKTHGSPSDLEAKGDLDLAKPTEEDECVEAIRLLLIQNSVALGKISPEKAVRAMNLPYDADKMKESKNAQKMNNNEVDAGEIDIRLAGCGSVSSAVQSALELWKENLVSHTELLDLVQKDLQYNRLHLPGAENESKLKEDSAFWGRFAFGERWAEKKARIQASSVFGAQNGWDLTGVIVKSNDDLRQEAFAMQLIELCAEAFKISGLELWTYPYRILATGRTTGIIEMVQNSMSFDSLKKRPGYEEGGMLGHFKKMTEYEADPPAALKIAKKNFVRSLASYSLLSHLFVFKDRHNGNLLLDTAGHVIHIDFGFIFGIAPGGSFSLEQSIPFKLTEEMIEVMDGLGSPLFSEFVTLFCCGFLALQAHCETFLTIVDITCEGSTFKCFEGKETKEITSKLRERFCPELTKEETISHAMDLIRLSFNATGTKQYDFFQYMSQGIAA
jgi:phosphatidylinositol kinase/protein kinase (PI-3  family)